jgi:hypothetical protein
MDATEYPSTPGLESDKKSFEDGGLLGSLASNHAHRAAPTHRQAMLPFVRGEVGAGRPALSPNRREGVATYFTVA